MSHKAHFGRFLAAAPGRLHFAAHSHHLWPDVSLAAQERCWQDAARLVDDKWAEAIFAEVYPAAQAHVARTLGLSDPTTLAFGPNTHGFVLRLLSHFPAGQAIRVLTTDGEFHAFARQLRRLEEEGLAAATRIATEPFADFPERFAAAAQGGRFDLVYVSQVFYDSGYALPDPAGLVEAVARPGALTVVDGYHGFMALPTDLAAIEARAFYTGGGYKYAMAGEGACFLHAPPGLVPRPRDTGWYAAFEALEAADETGVPYPASAARFLGATFDPVGLYRLNAAMDWLRDAGVTVAAIHEHAHRLQRLFVEGLAGLGLAALHPGQLVVPLEEANRGNFLTFRTADAGAIYARLHDAGVITDHRGDRLRFGFGLYQDEEDVARLCAVLGRVLG